ncbi:hypothetical protein P7C70_g4266, partial [Phenoliferia sp. Uapishka_3]
MTPTASAAPKAMDLATCWLIKAEPDPRIIDGKDVSFSIDEFERVGVTTWEGVRSHEAKKILKEKMKTGHRALFYASNTKIPGVAGLAKVVKEGYPDFNAWDPKHPYYDSKTKKDEPTWFMVDVAFVSRLPHFVPLKLFQALAACAKPPSCTDLSQSQLDAIKRMALLNRGRLSVQPVEDEVYEAVVQLGMKGGWEELLVVPKKATKRKAKKEEEDEGEPEVGGSAAENEVVKPSKGRRTVKKEEENEDQVGLQGDEEEEVKPSRPKRTKT